MMFEQIPSVGWHEAYGNIILTFTIVVFFFNTILFLIKRIDEMIEKKKRKEIN